MESNWAASTNVTGRISEAEYVQMSLTTLTNVAPLAWMDV